MLFSVHFKAELYYKTYLGNGLLLIGHPEMCNLYQVYVNLIFVNSFFIFIFIYIYTDIYIIAWIISVHLIFFFW